MQLGLLRGKTLYRRSCCSYIHGLMRARELLYLGPFHVNRSYLASTLRQHANSRSADLETQKLAPIEDARLIVDFEETKNIRDYLRRWQETHSNKLDAVRGPDTGNLPEGETTWFGNMLNDSQEAFDAGSEQLRATEGDRSEMSSAEEEDGEVQDFLEPGDLVSFYSSDGTMSFGIYIQSIQKQLQFYTDRGKWRIAFPKDLDHVIKRFTNRDLLTPLLPYIPDTTAELSDYMQSAIEGGVPRPVGAHLINPMAALASEVKQLYRENSCRLDTIHERVADDKEKRILTLDELTAEGLNLDRSQVNNIARLAVHMAARQNKFLIERDKSTFLADSYVIQPKRIAVVLDTVTKWVREHRSGLARGATDAGLSKSMKNHPLQEFIEKAQRFIQFSRAHRSPTRMASVGPTANKFEPGQNGEAAVCREIPIPEKFSWKFNEEDKMILEFLLHYAVPPWEMTSGTLRSTGSHIMRATGMYDTMEVNPSSMPLFLQEIGVVSPWENMRLLNQSLMLPGHKVSEAADNMWARAQTECDKTSSSLVDSMKNLRTDWGDLPVYCVDNPDAQEIDDGVSLEPIPGCEDTFWIRVHVANPSAFLDHDGVIAGYAALRLQSLYVPERTYPMLPKSFTHKHFSLGPGRPSLTFSAKMNLQGDVLDINITNGIVRNVVYTTHDILREMFEPESKSHSSVLTVGGKAQRREDGRGTLSDADKATFRTLRKLLLAFHDYRLRNGAIDFPFSSNNSVSVEYGAPMEPYQMQVDQARFLAGDPIIRLPVTKTDPHEVPDLTKRYLISTIMNLAGWVAGKWCAARNIPVIYDGTWYHPEYIKLTNENVIHYGGDGWRTLAPPKGISSPAPVHHAALGLEAYVKCTSPLRRYTDLLAHFQIEAALRHEHIHRRPLNTANSPSVLPFSAADVDKYISCSRWKLRALRDCDRSSKQFWACLLLFRAFYFGECDLPDTFPVLLQQPYSLTALLGTEYQDGFMGMMSSLGVRCQVLVPDGFTEILEVFSLIEAKITEVSIARNLVTVEPVRVVKKFERIGEWA